MFAVRMSSFQFQGKFITEQFTPAEETLTEIKEVFFKSEEEVEVQHRLLDSSLIPRIILHRIDRLLDYVGKEEVFFDQRLCKQEKNSSLDKEEPEPLQIKEEQQKPEHPWTKEETMELPISDHKEQLFLKKETGDTLMVNPTLVEEYHVEPQSIRNQVISQDFYEIQNQDPEQIHPTDSGSEQDKGPRHYNKCQKTIEHKNSVNGSKPRRNKETLTDKSLFSCTICGDSFSQNRDLILHLKSHCREKPFQCLRCGESFLKKTHLTVHMRTHTGGKIYECLSCGKSFINKSFLDGHIRVHTGEKPFCCSICERNFTTKSQLTSHMTTHSDQRPFSCKTCGKMFKRKDVLKEHMRTHTGQKMYECQSCGKSFNIKFNLDAHLRIHTGEKPFSCATCGKNFAQKSQLTSHMTTHSDERPFSCKSCGKTFKRRALLNSQMKTHTGEKSFKCRGRR
ncbi:zinc finger protein OZF-like [Cyprinodon tularosa]|uniref:zinc finger protein OZF-like n=1 Tax=Cyprinodon tularosa TaxID=77115 RepID=UPI0018E22BD8|nr:zinc finger protein OZF-like [Cyprinodon tularosa]